jgi:hypothetical protein
MSCVTPCLFAPSIQITSEVVPIACTGDYLILGAMRSLAGTALLVTLAASSCGGSVAPGGDASGAVQGGDAGTGVACIHGPTLVQTYSAVVASVPVSDPRNPPQAGQYFWRLTSLAATPGGDHFLVAWSDVDAQSDTTEGMAEVVAIDAGAASAMPPASAPCDGIAVFDGTDFVVVGTAPVQPPRRPGQPSPVQMQRFDRAGRSVSSPINIESVPLPIVTSVVSTPRGLGVGLQSMTLEMGPTNPPPPEAHALLVQPGGQIEDDVVFSPTMDPSNGLWSVGTPALAIVRGQVVATAGDGITLLDWLGAPTQTTRTPFDIVGSFKDPLFGAPFASEDQLMIWGQGWDSGPYGGAPIVLYGGVPGAPFTAIARVDPSAIAQQPDGCGGVVTLLSNAGSPDADAGGPRLSIEASSAGRAVSLGTTLPYPSPTAIASTSTGYSVAWADTDGIHLATLAWM